MSKFEFKLPDIGEGVTEGEIVNWLVAVGDGVKEDQDLVEVMTDKATVTIGAPKAGKVAELKGDVGDVIPVGQVLVVLDLAGGGEAAAAPAPAAKPAAEKAAAKPEPAPEKAAAKAPEKKSGDDDASPVFKLQDNLPGVAPSGGGAANGANGGYFNDKPLAAPATRKLARELDVDLRRVAPTGPNQRVTREDVESHARKGPAAARAPEARAPEAPALPPAPRVVEARGDQRVPIRGVKRAAFERMARSKRTAAHFTYFEECEVTPLMELRSRIKGYAEAEGVKLNFLPLIIKAVIAALRKNPSLNAVVDDEKGELVLKGSFDIGIAVATDNGLVVPVLR
ncbi:MAG TPA: dihydrolipoamide acetyltransferase family protein, partial [Usitatibacter sp.]|nr:dihydrolipoamide acetyltransferase family protein [Usitatibacter sp.]